MLPVRGGTLRVVGDSDVDHLLSTSGYTTNSASLLHLYTRQLFSYASRADVETPLAAEPDLASELPTLANGGISADGRVYVVHLRPRVLWNSTPPRPVVAEDFVRAFKFMCNPVSPVGAPGYYTSTIEGMAAYCAGFSRTPGTVAAIRLFIATHDLQGVRARDATTLEFRLVRPTSDFIDLLAIMFASPIPDEYLDYLPDSPQFRQHTLSIGPYAITRYAQGRFYELERNPVWEASSDPLRPAYVDHISLQLGSDSELMQLQIEAGTRDLTFGVPMLTANLASLDARRDPRVLLLPKGEYYTSMYYLAINERNAVDRRLMDLRLRKALALAIDRATLVKLAGGPRAARPLYQAVSSSVSGFKPATDRLRGTDDGGDPEAARALLAQAQFDSSRPLKLVTTNSGIYPILAQSVQANLARLGIESEIRTYPTGDFYGRLMPDLDNAARGEWDLAVANWAPDWYSRNNGRSVISPIYDGRNLHGLSMNFGGYDSAATNAAIDRALAATGIEAADAAWQQAATQVIDEVGVIPLIEAKRGMLRSARVRHCLWFSLSESCDLASLWLVDAGGSKQGERP